MDPIAPGAKTPSSRSAAVVHIAPPDAQRLVQLVLPALTAAAPPDDGGLRTLILTTDPDVAAATAQLAARELGGGSAPIVALTGASRARRVLAASKPAAVAMPVDVAAALLAQAALPLAGVKQVVVALCGVAEWGVPEATLDAVLAELPKSAVRTLVSAIETPAVDALIERHFFKARHVRDTSPPARKQTSDAGAGELWALAATPASRWSLLRRLLDEVDPPSAAIVANDAATLAEAYQELAALGYANDPNVIATLGELGDAAALVVWLGLPTPQAATHALAATPRLVVMATPSELADLRATVAPLPVRPLRLDGALARAAAREARARSRLREILASGEYAREVASVVPLLDEYDAVDVAAASLALWSEAVRAASAPPASAPPPPRQAREVGAGSGRESERPQRPRRDERSERSGGFRGAPREGARGGPREGSRGGGREGFRSGGRDGPRGGSREGFRGSSRDDRSGRGPGRPYARGDRGPAAAPRPDRRSPRRDDDRSA